MIQTKGYISDVLTNAAMEFISAHKDGPFFCYLPFNAPHTPMQVADSYYDDWFVDARKNPISRPTIDIGHPEWPETKLTVPEAYFSKGLRWYNGYGFAHDWITDWNKTGQKIWWKTNIITAGRYKVSLKYACAADAVGTKLRVRASGASLTGAIKNAHTPNPHQRPTRIKKKRFVQTFAVQELGTIELRSGRAKVMVEIVDDIGAQSKIDLHSLLLERVSE